MKVFGLIGEHLTHSLSPIIHKYIYELINVEASYGLYQVQPTMLQYAVQGIKALGIQGVNVTIPYKIKVMDYLDQISPEAQKIGAVNTIVNNGSALSGYNTDYMGFGRMLDKYHIKTAGMTAVVLGSGGAAKSAVSYLENAGVSDIFIVTRTPISVSFFDKYQLLSFEQLSIIKHSNILVNCTPVGMYPNIDSAPISQKETSKFDVIVDLIYNPACTLLMQQGNNLGIPTYNGLYMLVAQAVAAVEIWYNIKISNDITDKVYESLIDYIKA
jgi:shikimate dehydrogenase